MLGFRINFYVEMMLVSITFFTATLLVPKTNIQAHAEVGNDNKIGNNGDECQIKSHVNPIQKIILS